MAGQDEHDSAVIESERLAEEQRTDKGRMRRITESGPWSTAETTPVLPKS